MVFFGHTRCGSSFAEIYNENIFDLLEKLPEPKRKGEKPRRIPMKLAEEKGGAVYIKGLKEVPVSSSDEAYQLLMIGRQNLQVRSKFHNPMIKKSEQFTTFQSMMKIKLHQPNFWQCYENALITDFCETLISISKSIVSRKTLV